LNPSWLWKNLRYYRFSLSAQKVTQLSFRKILKTNATIINSSKLLTGFVPFFRNNFPGLFQLSQMHNNWSNKQLWKRNPKITLQKIVFEENFITRVYRFPGLSRTRINFPGLSRPGKCQNKIPALSRISTTRTNPVLSISSSNSKVETTLNSIINSTKWKPPVNRFHLNGETLAF